MFVPPQLEFHDTKLWFRSIARQRIRFRWLQEGDTAAVLFKIQGAHRTSKNRILALQVDGATISDEADMAQAAFDHFTAILGSAKACVMSLNLEAFDHRRFDLSELERPFTEEEIWAAVKLLPTGKALGPDGFTAEFLCACWGTIKEDICAVFDKLFLTNGRGFHKLNEALLTLIPKKQDAATLFDYRPISLIHLLAKLFAKVLSLRLAPRMAEIVSSNQSAFIAGQSVHDNFILVQQTARLSRKKKSKQRGSCTTSRF